MHSIWRTSTACMVVFLFFFFGKMEAIQLTFVYKCLGHRMKINAHLTILSGMSFCRQPPTFSDAMIGLAARKGLLSKGKGEETLLSG